MLHSVLQFLFSNYCRDGVNPKILYISNHDSSTLHLDYYASSFKRLPLYNVDIVSAVKSRYLRLLYKFQEKLFLPVLFSNLNRSLLKAILFNDYNLIIINKGNSILPIILKFIRLLSPKVKVAALCLNNMSIWGNKSLAFHFGLKYYDYILTVDIPAYYNVAEHLQVKPPIYSFDKCAFPSTHLPIRKTKQILSSDILFIGSYEELRSQYIYYLANAIPSCQIHVYGNGWDKMKITDLPSNLIIHGKDLVSVNYARAITNAKITLGFLRRANQDTQTSRTFEIPFCAGFMLMERSLKQQQLYCEGVEAEYFSDVDELISKVKYYIKHPCRRNKLRRAARIKSIFADNTYYTRASQLIQFCLSF